jgi:hypothetical protein
MLLSVNRFTHPHFAFFTVNFRSVKITKGLVVQIQGIHSQGAKTGRSDCVRTEAVKVAYI